MNRGRAVRPLALPFCGPDPHGMFHVKHLAGSLPDCGVAAAWATCWCRAPGIARRGGGRLSSPVHQGRRAAGVAYHPLAASAEHPWCEAQTPRPTERRVASGLQPGRGHGRRQAPARRRLHLVLESEPFWLTWASTSSTSAAGQAEAPCMEHLATPRHSDALEAPGRVVTGWPVRGGEHGYVGRRCLSSDEPSRRIAYRSSDGRPSWCGPHKGVRHRLG